MKISHVAIYVTRYDEFKAFYQKYFGAKPKPDFYREKTGMKNCFLVFEGGAELELMTRPDMAANDRPPYLVGYTHLSMGVGSETAVNELTERLKADGYSVLSGPRHTSDGYYESLVLDPDGNELEITI